MPRQTQKALIAELHNIADENPNAVTVKLGGTAYTLTGLYVGTVAGEQYGAVIIGDQTLLVELDRKGSLRNAKVLAQPDLDALSKDLLPEPPLPPEVIAAQELLDGLKLPKGYTLKLDSRGNPTITKTGGTGGPMPSVDHRGADPLRPSLP